MARTDSLLSHYCERAGDAAFTAEPLNSLTNLAFIVGAYLARQLITRSSPLPFRHYFDIWLLIISMVAIGIGSGLWHLTAESWALMADVLPIYVFINIAIFSLFIRLLELSWQKALLGWAIFQAVNVGIQFVLPADILNGSLMYLPTLGLLLLVSFWLTRKASPAARPLLITAGIFVVSLTFRTIDNEICGLLPIGTHFLWHCLNAVVLYKIVVALIPRKS